MQCRYAQKRKTSIFQPTLWDKVLVFVIWEVTKSSIFLQVLYFTAVSSCGGNHTQASGLLTSPSYPNLYPIGRDCIYLISQPNGTYINVTFINMDISCHASGSDNIEMRDGITEDSPLIVSFCGNLNNTPGYLQTTQNNLWIR